MSAPPTLLLDRGIGVWRAVAMQADERPFALWIFPDRSLLDAPRLGDRLSARVRAVTPGAGGSFLQTPDGTPLFLPFGKAGATAPDLVEGADLIVTVQAEAYAEKAARVRRAPAGAGPHLLTEAESFNVWRQSLPGGNDAVLEDDGSASTRQLIDHALEEAQSGSITLDGGGRLHIEATRGAVMMDIDSAGRTPTRKSSKALNETGVREAARQISLRNLGGLVLIDLVGAPRGDEARGLRDTLAADLKALSRRKAEVLASGPFGLMQASLARSYAPLEAGVDARLASGLKLWHAVLDAGEAARTARLRIDVSPDMHTWLQACAFDWAGTLAGRLGARFTLEDNAALGGVQWKVSQP